MEFTHEKTKHLQVQAWMEENIRNGTWPPGMPLPNVYAIAADLGVSMGTVRKAEGALATGGWISYPTAGRATLIIGVPTPRPAQLIGELRELHGAQGRKLAELSRLLGVPS